MEYIYIYIFYYRMYSGQFVRNSTNFIGLEVNEIYILEYITQMIEYLN
jgi:hypothetical protein